MQPRPEAYETLPFFTTSWLACFAQVGICSIIHSFSRRWCPLREGRSRGRNVWMEAFLGMIEIHRSPQLRWKCKAPSSIAVQHNAQFSGREGGSGHRLLLLGNLQIPVTTMEMVSQQIKWPLWGGRIPKIRATWRICPNPQQQHINKNRFLGLTSGHWLRISRERGCLSSTTGDSYHQASLESSLPS